MDFLDAALLIFLVLVFIIGIGSYILIALKNKDKR